MNLRAQQCPLNMSIIMVNKDSKDDFDAFDDQEEEEEKEK